MPIVKFLYCGWLYQREYIKSLLKQLNEEHPNLTNRLFKAIESSFIKVGQKKVPHSFIKVLSKFKINTFFSNLNIRYI